MKHKGDWHARKQAAIEEEFGEPIAELIYGMHWEDKTPLRHVAGALGVSEGTLRLWCEQLGIPTRKRGYEKMPTPGHVQNRARALGYESVEQAIAVMRQDGMRWEDIKRELGCADATMCAYYSEKARGFYHLTPEGREVKREVIRRLNDAGKNGKMPSLGYVTPYYQYDCH